MKLLALIALLLLPSCKSLQRLTDGREAEPIALEPETPLVLLPITRTVRIVAMGQSNMSGRGENTEYREHPHVVMTKDLRTGPAYYAASLLANEHPDWQINVVQCAEGGTGIDEWTEGQRLYNACLDQIHNTQGDILGVFWYQGESNARDNASFDPQWPEKAYSLLMALRGHIGSVPIVWAELGQLNDKIPAYQDNWRDFKINQLRLVLPNAIMIETDDQPTVDDVHHGYEANKVIGTRFLLALKQLAGM